MKKLLICLCCIALIVLVGCNVDSQSSSISPNEGVEIRKSDDEMMIMGEMTHKYISSYNINVIEFELGIFNNYNTQLDNNQDVTSVIGNVYDGGNCIKTVDLERKQGYTSKLISREDMAAKSIEFIQNNNIEIGAGDAQRLNYYKGEIQIEGDKLNDPRIDVTIQDNRRKMYTYILNSKGSY